MRLYSWPSDSTSNMQPSWFRVLGRYGAISCNSSTFIYAMLRLTVFRNNNGSLGEKIGNAAIN